MPPLSRDRAALSRDEIVPRFDRRRSDRGYKEIRRKCDAGVKRKSRKGLSTSAGRFSRIVDRLVVENMRTYESFVVNDALLVFWFVNVATLAFY